MERENEEKLVLISWNLRNNSIEELFDYFVCTLEKLQLRENSKLTTKSLVF